MDDNMRAYWRKLEAQVRDLRASLLDVLTLVRASNDPYTATTGMVLSEVQELRNRARQVEHRDHIIRRARDILDGIKEEQPPA